MPWQSDNLLDELKLFVHPLGVDSGARLFEDGGEAVELALVDSHAYDNDVVALTYSRVGP